MPTAPSACPTEALAREAAEGDREALGSLYDLHADVVVRFIVNRVHNHELALDLAATTWEKVAKAVSGYQQRPDSGGFIAWLLTIAKNTATEHARWSGRRKEYLDGEMLAYDQADPGDTPEQAAERRMVSHTIAAMVETLPPAQRRAVTLRFFTGLSVLETADVMRKSPGSVKQLQFRGLRTLRDRLGGQGLEQNPTVSDVVTHLDDAADPSTLEQSA